MFSVDGGPLVTVCPMTTQCALASNWTSVKTRVPPSGDSCRRAHAGGLHVLGFRASCFRVFRASCFKAEGLMSVSSPTVAERARPRPTPARDSRRAHSACGSSLTIPLCKSTQDPPVIQGWDNSSQKKRDCDTVLQHGPGCNVKGDESPSEMQTSITLQDPHIHNLARIPEA
eukprot:886155-Pyramimonas_sp.AAC.1